LTGLIALSQATVTQQLAQHSAECLQVVIGDGQRVAVAESLSDLSRLAEAALGGGCVAGGQMQAPQFVLCPPDGVEIPELLCGAQGGAQRAHQLQPAPDQAEQPGQGPGQGEDLTPAPLTVQPPKQAEQDIDLVFDLSGREASVGDLVEEGVGSLNLGG
jgi:hypothetical protein